ncbi:MAG: hypothetical protein ASUL_09189 [Candidatus Aramenus sulfurataquae]|uniref:Transposase n=1 Tax=Candidatus Aramenus sulfurataquae TaxID=1326980 RepID=W7KJT2_9CREN|nr:MAG: hypothetical protein ASUL_09189 [Candidatus Aramenus sulfurataquae]
MRKEYNLTVLRLKSTRGKGLHLKTLPRYREEVRLVAKAVVPLNLTPKPNRKLSQTRSRLLLPVCQ